MPFTYGYEGTSRSYQDRHRQGGAAEDTDRAAEDTDPTAVALSPAHLLNHLYWEFSNTSDLVAYVSSEILSYFFTGRSTFVIRGVCVLLRVKLKDCAMG